MVCIYLGGYIYAHQVHTYIETGVHCYTRASCRKLKGYWVSEDSLPLFRSHHFPNLFPALIRKVHYPETAVVTPLWKDSAFQLLNMEATQFDRFFLAGILTADIPPSDGKGLGWIKRR